MVERSLAMEQRGRPAHDDAIRAQLERADEVKSNFIALAAHENQTTVSVDATADVGGPVARVGQQDRLQYHPQVRKLARDARRALPLERRRALGLGCVLAGHGAHFLLKLDMVLGEDSYLHTRVFLLIVSARCAPMQHIWTPRQAVADGIVNR